MVPLLDFLGDYTLRTVALGAAALGTVSGALGSYAVLRKRSLLGDAISHAALPGIALAFLLTGSKATLVLLAGAAAAGWLGTLLVMRIVGTTRVKEDSALGIVLSVFFGLGLVLLTHIQKLPDASQAGLDRFLFGQAATLLHRDVVMIAGLGAVALLVAMLFWKEFKLLSFDPDFGASLGFPMRAVDVVLTSVLVLSIVIGLQTVGVVLMSAMVVAPAAAARQWTDRMGGMVALAGAFGALAGVSGSVLSSLTARLPTGPTIVLCLTAVVLVSLALAPNRGLVWEWVRDQRSRRALQTDAVLSDLRALARQHDSLDHGHSIKVLEAMRFGRGGARSTLETLAERGWARRTGADEWSITPAGLAEAERRAPGKDEEERP
ncbi:MAG TPA: metal ABC transporter permease [Longimicrobiaceae bacterium]|nr:metal ABC transporter permease [Longimicrobiaceae bacterium]